MLKIKDNVDLKELEKFGFKKICYETKDAWLQYFFYGSFGRFVVFEKSRCIYFETDECCYRSSEELTPLYDLIQAGLVEKVGD